MGTELANHASSSSLVAVTEQQLDITDSGQIRDIFESAQPDILINAAAYTQVDRAENEAELTFAINRDGVASLAQACVEFDIPMLHISTDYIFDGCKQGAYTESDSSGPLGIYGQSKDDGEAELRDKLNRHIILRTSWVFSATGSNFVKTMLRVGETNLRLGYSRGRARVR